MALWRRIQQSRIHTKLWNQFTVTRSYIQIHSSVAITAKPTENWFLNSPRLLAQQPLFEMPTNVRFFSKKKFKRKSQPQKIEKEPTGPRLNEEITDDVVRLVTDEGHTIMSKDDALKLARSLDLDLVEVQRNVTPPVCKIKDYLRDKYKQESKEKERAKEKSGERMREGCKAIRFSGEIRQNDLQVKADAAKRLMEKGYRVKCLAIGNAIDNGGESSTALLSRFLALVEDITVIESHARVEDKDQEHAIMRHVKYGPMKKGSVNKVSTDRKSPDVIGDTDVEETENPGWAAADGGNVEFDQLFDIPENPDNIFKRPDDEAFSIAQEKLRSDDHPITGGRRETSRPMPGFSNTMARQPQDMGKFPQQGFPPKTPVSSTPNFGIFSTRKNAPDQNGAAPEVNRYKQRHVSDSQRSSSPPRRHGNVDISSSRHGNGQVRPSHQ